jgi:hypothetical protein
LPGVRVMRTSTPSTCSIAYGVAAVIALPAA